MHRFRPGLNGGGLGKWRPVGSASHRPRPRTPPVPSAATAWVASTTWHGEAGDVGARGRRRLPHLIRLPRARHRPDRPAALAVELPGAELTPQPRGTQGQAVDRGGAIHVLDSDRLREAD